MKKCKFDYDVKLLIPGRRYSAGDLKEIGIRTNDSRVRQIGLNCYEWISNELRSSNSEWNDFYNPDDPYEDEEDDENKYDVDKTVLKENFRIYKPTDAEIVSQFEHRCKNLGIPKFDIWEAMDASFREGVRICGYVRESDMTKVTYEPGKLTICTPDEAVAVKSHNGTTWTTQSVIEAYDGEKWTTVNSLTVGLFYRSETLLNLGLDVTDGDFVETRIPRLNMTLFKHCGKNVQSKLASNVNKAGQKNESMAIIANAKANYEPVAAAKVATPAKIYVNLGPYIAKWLKSNKTGNKEIWGIVEAFNPADSTKVLKFAHDVQDNLALFSDKLLQIGNFDSALADKNIKELAEYFEGATKPSGFWKSMFGASQERLDAVDVETVDKLATEIKKSIDNADMRIRAFEAAMEENDAYLKQLKIHIEAAEAISQWGVWVQMQGDLYEGVLVRDIVTNLKFLERKVYDLRLLLVSSEQTVSQLIIGKETVMGRIDQVNKVIRISIPLWKKQLVAYRTLKNSTNQKNSEESYVLLMKTQCDIVATIKVG
jgi:hypothetical protein